MDNGAHYLWYVGPTAIAYPARADGEPLARSLD
jgi:hypothetical protein